MSFFLPFFRFVAQRSFYILHNPTFSASYITYRYFSVFKLRSQNRKKFPTECFFLSFSR